MKTQLSLVLLLSLGSCTVFDKNADTIFAKDEVIAELDHYYTDLSKRDWSAVEGHFFPEAIITTVHEAQGDTPKRVDPVSVKEFIAALKQGPASKPHFEERLIDYKVDIDGGMARVWAKVHTQFGETGNLQEWTGTDAFSLMAQDKRYLIMSLTFPARK